MRPSGAMSWSTTVPAIRQISRRSPDRLTAPITVSPPVKRSLNQISSPAGFQASPVQAHSVRVRRSPEVSSRVIEPSGEARLWLDQMTSQSSTGEAARCRWNCGDSSNTFPGGDSTKRR